MVVKIRLSRPNVIILRILLGLACVLVAWPYVTSFAAVGYGYAWWMVTPGPPRWDVSSPANATAVPKIIHQTWKEETVPEKWRAAQKSCRDLHPDYEYRLWTDSQALDFIEREYPWFLPTFLAYPYPIQRVDAIRYFILYHFGGVYLDLDVGCNRRFDALLGARFLAPLTMPIGISNDIMAAVPGDPYLHRCIQNLRGWNLWMALQYVQVMFSTGPMFLTIQLALASAAERAGVAAIAPADYGKYAAVKGGQAFFYHLHGSSWHTGSAPFFLWMYAYGKPVAILALVALVAGLVAWRLRARAAQPAPKQDEESAFIAVIEKAGDRYSPVGNRPADGRPTLLRQKSSPCNFV